MRYVLTCLLVMSMAVVGCKPKDKGPQTMSNEVPAPQTPPSEAMAPAAPAMAPVEPAPAQPKPIESLSSPVPAATTGSGTYVIQPGDTFIKIARKLFNDEHRYKDIMALNPGVDPHKLRVGQVINVPEK